MRAHLRNGRCREKIILSCSENSSLFQLEQRIIKFFEKRNFWENFKNFAFIGWIINLKIFFNSTFRRSNKSSFNFFQFFSDSICWNSMRYLNIELYLTSGFFEWHYFWNIVFFQRNKSSSNTTIHEHSPISQLWHSHSIKTPEIERDQL